MIDDPRLHEQQVREAVDPAQPDRIGLVRLGERRQRAFRTTTDRTRHVQTRRALAAAGQDERPELGQPLLRGVDRGLEGTDVVVVERRDARVPIRRRG